MGLQLLHQHRLRVGCTMTQQTVTVPRRPAELDAAHLKRIQDAQRDQQSSQNTLEQAVLDALAAGASTRAITAATGIAGSTIQRYVNRGRSGNV